MNDKEQFRKEKTCFPLPKSIRSVSTLLFFPTFFFYFSPFSLCWWWWWNRWIGISSSSERQQKYRKNKMEWEKERKQWQKFPLFSGKWVTPFPKVTQFTQCILSTLCRSYTFLRSRFFFSLLAKKIAAPSVRSFFFSLSLSLSLEPATSFRRNAIRT